MMAPADYLLLKNDLLIYALSVKKSILKSLLIIILVSLEIIAKKETLESISIRNLVQKSIYIKTRKAHILCQMVALHPSRCSISLILFLNSTIFTLIVLLISTLE